MSTHAIPPLVALTAEPGLVSAHELAVVAAALQTQITNDVARVWHTPATVAAFPDPSRIPAGYWPIIVKADLNEPGAAGYHADRLGQPVSYVQAGDGWSVTASHELVEMLVDPWGRRLVTCPDPRGAELGHAHVLVEACDPCEALTYPVLGVNVSDFVLPSYYGSHRWSFGRTPTSGPIAFGHSHLGHLTAPLTVNKGGYLSWLAADGHWWQMTWFAGATPKVVDINAELHALLATGLGLREAIDRLTH